MCVYVPVSVVPVALPLLGGVQVFMVGFQPIFDGWNPTFPPSGSFKLFNYGCPVCSVLQITCNTDAGDNIIRVYLTNSDMNSISNNESNKNEQSTGRVD